MTEAKTIKGDEFPDKFSRDLHSTLTEDTRETLRLFGMEVVPKIRKELDALEKACEVGNITVVGGITDYVGAQLLEKSQILAAIVEEDLKRAGYDLMEILSRPDFADKGFLPE